MCVSALPPQAKAGRWIRPPPSRAPRPRRPRLSTVIDACEPVSKATGWPSASVPDPVGDPGHGRSEKATNRPGRAGRTPGCGMAQPRCSAASQKPCYGCAATMLADGAGSPRRATAWRSAAARADSDWPSLNPIAHTRARAFRRICDKASHHYTKPSRTPLTQLTPASKATQRRTTTRSSKTSPTAAPELSTNVRDWQMFLTHVAEYGRPQQHLNYQGRWQG